MKDKYRIQDLRFFPRNNNRNSSWGQSSPYTESIFIREDKDLQIYMSSQYYINHGVHVLELGWMYWHANWAHDRTVHMIYCAHAHPFSTTWSNILLYKRATRRVSLTQLCTFNPSLELMKNKSGKQILSL